MPSKRYSHLPLPTVRLNAKRQIIRPTSPMRPYLSGRTLDLAVKFPLAPITNLSNQERIQMEQPLLTPKLTYMDLQAYSTAVQVAEFVLE